MCVTFSPWRVSISENIKTSQKNHCVFGRMRTKHKSLWGISFSKMPLVTFWFFLWSWFWKKIIKWIVDFYVVWCTWLCALPELNPSWLCLHGPFSSNAPSPTHNSWKTWPLHCLKWLPSLLKKIHDTGEYNKRKNLNKKFEQVFMLTKSGNNRFYQIGAGVRIYSHRPLFW